MKTSISEKIAYGMGDVACNVVYALTSGLIVYFYTNVIGVSAGVVGTILLVSRVFDGVSDLLIAQLMDKIKQERGFCGWPRRMRFQLRHYLQSHRMRAKWYRQSISLLLIICVRQLSTRH